jgi:hypothetical protein
MVNKLLHQPMTELKSGAGGPDGALLIDAVRRLFALTEDAPEAKERSAEPSGQGKVTQLAAATSGHSGDSK